jgi:LysM repeat protein
VAGRGWRAELKRYGAPAAFLAAVTVAVLLVRSGLQTHSSSGTTISKTTTAVSTPSTARSRPKRARFYRLRAGETISDVAIRFRTTVEELLALNPGVEPTALNVGQRIRVG